MRLFWDVGDALRSFAFLLIRGCVEIFGATRQTYTHVADPDQPDRIEIALLPGMRRIAVNRCAIDCRDSSGEVL